MAMANREPIDADNFRSCPQTPIAAQQNANAGRDHLIPAVLNTIRLLKRITGVFMRHLLIAMHESRRKQALTIIARFDDLEPKLQIVKSGSQRCPRQGASSLLQNNNLDSTNAQQRRPRQ
jgi:hypothetical protein